MKRALPFLLFACSSAPAIPAPPPPVDMPAPQPTPDAGEEAVTLDETLAWHHVRVDKQDRLLPAFAVEAPFPYVAKLGLEAWKKTPTRDGFRTYDLVSTFRADPGHELEPFEGDNYPTNRAGLGWMFADTAIAAYTYFGDRAIVDQTSAYLDFEIAHGLTKTTDAWASVPYASSDGGDIDAHGSSFCGGCGKGDGPGIIETDKVGEFGLGFLRFWQLTGQQHYFDSALACARALASHVRSGDETHSPWPFRVDAETGTIIVEEYTANVVPIVELFDEISPFAPSDAASFSSARSTAWSWFFAHPMKNHFFSNYFEDVVLTTLPSENPTQYIALEAARYLLAHPNADPDWRAHVDDILSWTTTVFAADYGDRYVGADGIGRFHGAEAISEQWLDMEKMGSHTARFASVLALYGERTGDTSARERALRSFNWATYMSSAAGIVVDKPSVAGIRGWWSDSYGDYMRHFLVALASVPEWVPDEDRILRSSTILKAVTYAAGTVRYAPFAPSGVEVLRLRKAPTSVTGAASVDVKPLASGFLVAIHRDIDRGEIVVQ